MAAKRNDKTVSNKDEKDNSLDVTNINGERKRISLDQVRSGGAVGDGGDTGVASIHSTVTPSPDEVGNKHLLSLMEAKNDEVDNQHLLSLVEAEADEVDNEHLLSVFEAEADEVDNQHLLSVFEAKDSPKARVRTRRKLFFPIGSICRSPVALVPADDEIISKKLTPMERREVLIPVYG